MCHAVLLWSLPSYAPNLRAPGMSTEKRNWEFKPLQLSSPGGCWWRGGHGCRMQTRSSKTFFQGTVSSQSISPSYFLEIEPIVTIKSRGWKRFWGHRVQLLLSQVSLVRICILTVIPPTDAAFALRFSFAICNKYELYHFQFLKGWQLEVSKSKVFLFCFSVVLCFRCVRWSLSPFTFRISCLKTN